MKNKVENQLKFDRIPVTKHPSLKAWNAADELLIENVNSAIEKVSIYHDSFGYLSCHLTDHQPYIISHLKSQETAISTNAQNNGVLLGSSFFHLDQSLPLKVDLALLKVPKSLNLLEVYLMHIHQNLSEDGEVIAGFMTKYFNSGILKIAEKYFHTVAQSKAKKKARLLFLKDKKEVDSDTALEKFNYNQTSIQQYKGVFSSGKIDKATQFLLNHIMVPENHNRVLDLACGNGIIAQQINAKTDIKELHLMDDSYLAIASAKLNLTQNANFHYHFDLGEIKGDNFDWIITNPPFHFEHTIDTSIPIGLFLQAHQKLNTGGYLTIVANSNLGYEKILNKTFREVSIIASNSSFQIFHCQK